MGGTVERPIEIRTSAILLDFSLTHNNFENIKRCRGVHAIDYSLLDGKSGTEILQKHPHPTINSLGAQEGWVSLGVSS
jgi:hypothetical protein